MRQEYPPSLPTPPPLRKKSSIVAAQIPCPKSIATVPNYLNTVTCVRGCCGRSRHTRHIPRAFGCRLNLLRNFLMLAWWCRGNGHFEGARVSSTMPKGQSIVFALHRMNGNGTSVCGVFSRGPMVIPYIGHLAAIIHAFVQKYDKTNVNKGRSGESGLNGQLTLS